MSTQVRMSRRAIRFLACALPLLAVSVLTRIPLSGQSGARNGEWRYYGGDAGSTKYSPLDQINKDNVKDLRIAWRWKTENFGTQPDYNYQVTPLMVGGILYATAGSRRDVVAIDGATGETLWMFRFDEGVRGQKAPIRAGRRPRRGVLDRRPGGTHPPCHAWLSSDCVGHEDRSTCSRLRQGRRHRPLRGARSAHSQGR